jgi:hypothetical protein
LTSARTQRQATSAQNSTAGDFLGVGLDPTVGGISAALGSLQQLQAGGLEESYEQASTAQT